MCVYGNLRAIIPRKIWKSWIIGNKLTMVKIIVTFYKITSFSSLAVCGSVIPLMPVRLRHFHPQEVSSAVLAHPLTILLLQFSKFSSLLCSLSIFSLCHHGESIKSILDPDTWKTFLEYIFCKHLFLWVSQEDPVTLCLRIFYNSRVWDFGFQESWADSQLTANQLQFLESATAWEFFNFCEIVCGFLGWKLLPAWPRQIIIG